VTVVRICYLVLSHAAPEQAERLLDAVRCSDPEAVVLVRHDQFASPTSREPDMGGRPDAHLIHVRRPAGWGSYAFSESVLDAMRWADERLDFDWLAVLTGQDYVARPLHDLKELLVADTADAFVKIEAVGNGTGWNRSRDTGAELYRYRYYGGFSTARRPFSRLGKLQDLARYQPFVSVRVNPRDHLMLGGYRSPRAPFSAGFVPVKGRNWFALNRRALRLLVRFVDTHPEVVRHYERSFISGESFFQTILWNLPEVRVHPEDLHYESWRAESPHPDDLDVDDLEAIVASGAYFARKIHPRTSAALLDALDEVVRRR
jgi:hypothetical protein